MTSRCWSAKLRGDRNAGPDRRKPLAVQRLQVHKSRAKATAHALTSRELRVGVVHGMLADLGDDADTGNSVVKNRLFQKNDVIRVFTRYTPHCSSCDDPQAEFA